MTQYEADRRHAIAVVESLRTGIPTRRSTQGLPDLRAPLTDRIRTDLAHFQPGPSNQGRLAWGPYGQGKTHALTTIEHVALEMGFAVSRVSLNREVSCHHLFNFYGRVASDLRTPESKTPGISQLLSRKAPGKLTKSPIKDPSRYVHSLPALILEDALLSTGEDQHLLYADLMGTRLTMTELKRLHRLCRGSSFPKFGPFRTTQHATAYYGVMADALVLWGYKGWVILIDEVELIGRLRKVSRMEAYRNLNWLLNWSGSMPYPIYTFGVVASGLRNDKWFKEGSTSKIPGDRHLMPTLAGERIGPDDEADLDHFFEQAISDHCPTIAPLDQTQLIVFLDHIVDYHSQAYDWDPDLNIAALLTTIGSQPIRTYIRATLESLDIAYLYHQNYQPSPADLVEGSLEEDESYFSVKDEVA